MGHRDDVSKSTADDFGAKVIASKETGTVPPVRIVDGASFLYARHKNLYFVAVTRSNVNPALVLEFLFQWIRILKSYLGEEFDDEDIRNSMTLIYELMDGKTRSAAAQGGPPPSSVLFSVGLPLRSRSPN